MVAVNRSFQSGHHRAFIQHEPFSATNRLYITSDGYMYTMQNGALVGTPMTEGVMPSDDQCAFSWSDMVEDSIIDIFKAVAKALEIYSDEPGQAYKQGYAEGEAAILREWNQSLSAQVALHDLNIKGA